MVRGRCNLIWKECIPVGPKSMVFFVQMGGFVLSDGGMHIQVLDYHSPHLLLSREKIEGFNLTKTDIEDRSKGDGLSKLLVLCQTTWFVAQCISRRVQNLAMTELELVSLAFSLLNGFMYFFWWDKPLDVRTPVHLYWKSDLSAQDKDLYLFCIENITWALEETNVFKTPVIRTERRFITDSNSPGRETEQVCENSKTSCLNLRPWLMNAMRALYKRLLDMSVFLHFQESEKIKRNTTHVHIFYACCPYQAQAEKMLAIASMIAVLFGAIHCGGWNFIFPSTTESMLWRISSLIVATAPLLMEVRFLLYNPGTPVERRYRLPRLQKLAWSFTVYIALPFYFLARIVLLVESVITLRDISPSALATVHWASFLPHI